MNETSVTATIWPRLVLVLVGGCAALALWALSEFGPASVLTPAIYLALFAFLLTYSFVALSLVGPVAPARALPGAFALALPVTALTSLAGARHLRATDLLDDPVTCGVLAMLAWVALPFLLVRLQDRRAWLHYGALFDASWTVTLRHVVALAFVGIFWLVVFLSNALLGLVDIGLIDAVLEREWAVFLLTGAMLGLGLAVVFELRDTISPYLILRLLRLLVPVVLAVVALFLLAVPVRGLSRLFGEFSSASTLMGAGIVAVTLVSTALDTSDARAVSTRGLRAATRALALILPFLCALAVWSVWLRVQQYGWTPDRLLAASVSGALLAYGLGYGLAALVATDWMRRIRAFNVLMVLGLMGLAVLWVTPLLNPYRISAISQETRYRAGAATLDQLPVWEMAREWGKAGQAALARLGADSELPDHADLVARTVAAAREENRWQYDQSIARRAIPDQVARLAQLMPVRPAGTALTAATFSALPAYRLREWLEACERSLPDGRAGCVLVRAEFAPILSAPDQAIVLYLDPDGRVMGNHVLFVDGAIQTVRMIYDPRSDTWPVLDPSVLAQVLDGTFRVAPDGGQALWVGGHVLAPAGN